jgi:RND family efflux transporter MFP subunit
LASLLLLAFGAWPDGRCLAQGHGPTRVEVATVVQREVAPTIELVGTLRPRLRTVVSAEVSGLVAELPVDEGDRVTKGQLLCKLRDTPRRFAHAESVARRAELAAVLAERTAELSKARFEDERTARLWEQNRCSGKERHDAQADHAAAQGRLDQARHARESQKAVVDFLADELARTEIRAPCDGYVVAKYSEIGSWVREGGGIVSLVDLSTVRVRLPVPENMIAFAELGADARVSIEALGRVYTGKISRIIPYADERARTFPVEVDIANPTGALKAGMFARGAMPSGPRAERLIVPKDAVVIRGSTSMVFVIRKAESGQMAIPVPVEIISELLDMVAVRAEGLVAGDQVVVRGNESMFGPRPVIAMPQAGAPTTQPAGDVRLSEGGISRSPATARSIAVLDLEGDDTTDGLPSADDAGR